MEINLQGACLSSLDFQTQRIEERLKYIENLPPEDSPDLVVISFLIWEGAANMKENVFGFDKAMEDMEFLAKILRTTSPHLLERGTQLIWLLLDDIKKISPLFFLRASNEMFNQIAIEKLKALVKQGLISLWDSGFPVSLRVFEDCYIRERRNFFSHFIKENRLDQDEDWMCSDVNHVGLQGTRVHIQLLYNYVCNRYLQPYRASRNVCCSHRNLNIYI